MRRRNFLTALGTLTGASGLVIGSGSFSQVESTRGVSVSVAGDAKGNVSLEPYPGGNTQHVDDSGSEISLAFGKVDPNAVSYADKLIRITNNMNEKITVGFDDEYETTQGRYSDSGGWANISPPSNDVVAVLWISPDVGDLNNSLSTYRPPLTDDGFSGGGLVDAGNVLSKVSSNSARTVDVGESLHLGGIVDTRNSTVNSSVPSDVDSSFSLIAST